MSRETCAGCGAELDPAIDRIHRVVVLRAAVLSDGTTQYRRKVLPERYCSEACAQEAADELREPNEVPPLVLPEHEAEGTDRAVSYITGSRPPFVVWEFREFFPLWLLDEPPWPWEPDYWGADDEESDDEG